MHLAELKAKTPAALLSRTATADPRDSHWFDRLYRWFLNRPALFVLVLLVAVAAIFITLLTLGPPGGATTE